MTRAHADGFFDVALASGNVRVPTPRYSMPRVPKLSAGYFACREMDLIDLFICSEGTLGIITEVTLKISERPAFCLAFVPFRDRPAALRFVRRLRDAAHGERSAQRADARAQPPPRLCAGAGPRRDARPRARLTSRVEAREAGG